MKYHKKWISNPQASPALWTEWDGAILAVNSNCYCRSLTDRTTTYVRLDFIFNHGHHWKRSSGWQPIGFVITAGVVAHITWVAVQERHCAEALQARSSETYWNKISVVSFSKYCGFYFCKLWQTVTNRLITCILCIKSYSIIAKNIPWILPQGLRVDHVLGCLPLLHS